MASKNLGAVIQRAISDGAFRRQLQSDPAAALRGFNLTPDEVAAIRSGDSGRLMSLGVDQRMSKAFSVGNLSGTRASTSDGGIGGTRSVNDVAPFEGNVNATIDPIGAGTRAVHDSEPADLRGAVADPTQGGTRAVNDVAPFGTTGSSAVEDAASPEYAATQHAGDPSMARAVNDVAPFGTPGSSAVEDSTSPEYSVASRMVDSGGDAVRPIHDTEPFDSGIANASAPADDIASADIQHDPGTITGGDALGNTPSGPESGDEHGWG